VPGKPGFAIEAGFCFFILNRVRQCELQKSQKSKFECLAKIKKQKTKMRARGAGPGCSTFFDFGFL
jgi:hypothetical protein